MAQAAQKQDNAQPTFNEMLEEGIELYRDLREKKSRLSEIKDMLRQHAEAKRNGVKTVELTTEDGEHTVSVTFPDPSLKVKSDNDEMASIREDLGELLFAMFFKEKTSYSVESDFEDNIVKVKDPLQRQELESAVEKKAATPRVSFPK